MFYPYVAISATQTCEGDDLRHAMLPFSFLFFGHAKNLGTCEATKDRSSESSKNREKTEHLWAASGGAFRLGQRSRSVLT